MTKGNGRRGENEGKIREKKLDDKREKNKDKHKKCKRKREERCYDVHENLNRLLKLEKQKLQVFCINRKIQQNSSNSFVSFIYTTKFNIS